MPDDQPAAPSGSPARPAAGATANSPHESDRARELAAWWEQADALEKLIRGNQLERDRVFRRNRETWLYLGVRAAGANRGLIGAFYRGWDAYVAGERANPYHHVERTDRRGRVNAGFRPAFRFAFDAGWAWAERQKATERVADLHTWAAFGVALPECLRTEKELQAQREQDQREQDPTARDVSRPAPATKRQKPQRTTTRSEKPAPDEPAPDEPEEDAP